SNRDARDVAFVPSTDGKTATITFTPNEGAGHIVARQAADATTAIATMKSRAAGHADANVADTTAVSITCSFRKAELIYGLMLLKDSLKGQVHSEQGAFNVLIQGTYDEADGILRDGVTTTIQLLEANIPGKAEEIIEINPTDATVANFPMLTGANDVETALNNLKTYKDELIEKEFRDGDGNISTYSNMDEDIKTLLTYDNAGAAGSVGADPQKERKTIYNLTKKDANAKNFLKDRIDNYAKILQELYAYHDIVGLNTLEEVLKVHANNFVFKQRGTAVPAGLGNGTL
ncbi:5267_t:CDS:2, partial [Funneliformis geosporum]